MKFLAVKFKPKSSFHLGEREEWREGSKTYIPADTLFSALVHCYQLLYGDPDNFIGQFKGDPPFLLSSAFPYWMDDFYFPLPRNKFLLPDELKSLKDILKKNPSGEARKSGANGILDIKAIKKIQYVNQPGLCYLLKGESLFSFILKCLEVRNFKTLPLLINFEPEEKTQPESRKIPWRIDNVPRIALSRLSSHPGENFFYFGEVYYEKKAGLFVLIKINRPEWENKIKAMFYLLSHEGLGGDRTCGKGILQKPEFTEIDLPDIEYGNGIYCLSPYYPADNEREGLAEGYYELEERKGYIFSPWGRSLRRRSIRLFAEGSVFPRNKERRGALVDVTPEAFKAHPVYRYGLLFSLPCQLEAK